MGIPIRLPEIHDGRTDRAKRRFLGRLAGLLTVAPFAPRASTASRVVLIQTSPIAGFQYHDGEAVWTGLRVGQALTLVRESRNPHDGKAVRVDWLGHKLGYVPRSENHAVAELLDRGAKLSARIAALSEKRDAHGWKSNWDRVRLEVLLAAEP
ncbi:HIRAN domain-containing protein [Nitrosovibrio sp. Nv17]|uniref:HIRAN domain-containing protein n=1 Tax=Nitrosovibrio sp. Nv17 TaxID=1855339 RepID=UPI000908F6FB|nr:HIRAN domain-containing protein [Nitrosovibrio sp. Nv17]SFW22694.1 HIRAN domain-containing protein [Nitrosovibrio sp. Nv17]